MDTSVTFLQRYWTCFGHNLDTIRWLIYQSDCIQSGAKITVAEKTHWYISRNCIQFGPKILDMISAINGHNLDTIRGTDCIQFGPKTTVAISQHWYISRNCIQFGPKISVAEIPH